MKLLNKLPIPISNVAYLVIMLAGRYVDLRRFQSQHNLWKFLEDRKNVLAVLTWDADTRKWKKYNSG